MLLEGGRTSCVPEARQSVRLIGAGPVSVAIARLLAQSRLGRLWLVDTDPKEGNHRPPDGVRAGRSERLRACLTSEFQMQVAMVNHWTRPSSAEVDLTVVVSDAAEADRLVADDLVRMDQPHLIVRSAGDFVTVGPLVIPGRTACLRCTDLTRRDADTAWPALLDQLTRLRLPTSPALGAWAASITVTQTLAFLRGGTAEAGGSTLELSQHDLVTRRRMWPAHPECGCHWLSAGQWSA
jgi:bacteriocin biosynthesis cyclodehydratase domain-containing protein